MAKSSSVVSNAVDILISFDTTGSMYPCLTQVRRNVKETVTRLMKEIPGIRIGIIAHGDYVDEKTSYVTKSLDFTDSVGDITRFVERVEPTGGGDAPECYELVMHEAQKLSWDPAHQKCFVLIGDDVPHGPNQNPKKLNWRTELGKLGKMGIPVYGVQALGRSHATPFYAELARESGGFHLSLDQFSHVTDMLLAICYKQTGDEKLEKYEREVRDGGRLNRSVATMFSTMLNRRVYHAGFAKPGLDAVPPSRFQVLAVDHDASIRDFVEDNGLRFNKGRGFYEFTKSETIQAGKEVVLMEKATGDMYTGNAARKMINLPDGVSSRLKPAHLDQYAVFVQSTSSNRRLVGGTRFLYEVEDWAR
jgi:Mg-chelatase subunit ChlD